MPRPITITEEDIKRWDTIINDEQALPPALLDEPSIREVFYAGLHLSDELKKLSCPNEIIIQLQFEAAYQSLGKDAWEIHDGLLNGYKEGNLENLLVVQSEQEDLMN